MAFLTSARKRSLQPACCRRPGSYVRPVPAFIDTRCREPGYAAGNGAEWGAAGMQAAAEMAALLTVRLRR